AGDDHPGRHHHGHGRRGEETRRRRLGAGGPLSDRPEFGSGGRGDALRVPSLEFLLVSSVGLPTGAASPVLAWSGVGLPRAPPGAWITSPFSSSSTAISS